MLRKGCQDLKLGDTSCVLLALSAVTDTMISAMHMFPEVQVIDVAANINKQKCNMLFSIVKEATGKCFIVNAIVMPCGQRWIFLNVYQTFFLYLYGCVAISRMELVLTDKDASSHGALADVKILENCWKDIVEMLCVFHGVVMTFHKTV